MGKKIMAPTVTEENSYIDAIMTACSVTLYNFSLKRQ